MSTVEPTDQPVPTAVLDGAVEEYPRDKLYVQVAVVLAAITVVEIATYAAPEFPLWHWGGTSNVGIISFLLILMAVKFWHGRLLLHAPQVRQADPAGVSSSRASCSRWRCTSR